MKDLSSSIQEREDLSNTMAKLKTDNSNFVSSVQDLSQHSDHAESIKDDDAMKALELELDE